MPLGIGYFDFIWHAEDFVSVTGHTAQGSSSERLSYFDDRLEVFLANRSPGSLAKVRYFHPLEESLGIRLTLIDFNSDCSRRIPEERGPVMNV
jgi:hypothetical protein